MSETRTLQDRYILKNARHLASDYLKRVVRPGDSVVDATMGNGNDTVFLAEMVGEEGHVYAFDVQQEAIARTKEKIDAAGYGERVTLLHMGHEHLAEQVPCPVQAIVFNLGWLPGAEHHITTRVETTLCAVEAAIERIVEGGVVSICIYPGHEEGKKERDALIQWAGRLDPRKYNVLHHAFLNAKDHSPQLILIAKN